MKMVDRKGGQKLNKVDRKTRKWTEKWTRNVKRWQKIQNDTQKTKNDTQGAKDDTKNGEYDTKNDTKNGTLTDYLQEVNNDAINTHDTKNDTKKIKEWNSLLLKQTYEMIVWWSINDCFGKEK